MNISARTILLIALINLLASAPSLIKGDEKLIHDLCYQSGTRDFCVDCVHTNPKAKELDKFEIETQLIFCTFNQSQYVQSRFEYYINNCQNCEPRQIPQLKSAAEDLDKAAEDATAALSTWNGGKGSYDDTAGHLSQARLHINGKDTLFIARQFEELDSIYLILLNWAQAATDVLDIINTDG